MMKTATHRPVSRATDIRRACLGLALGVLAMGGSAQVYVDGKCQAGLLEQNPWCDVQAEVHGTQLVLTSVRSLDSAPEGVATLRVPATCVLDGDSLSVTLAPCHDGTATVLLAEGAAAWRVEFDAGVPLPSDCSGLMAGSRRLYQLDAHRADLGGVRSMASMLEGCTMLEDADFSDCRADSVTDVTRLLAGCADLRGLTLPLGLAPRLAVGMMEGCTAIEDVDLGTFDTRNLTDMSRMLARCRTLQVLVVGPRFSVGAGVRRSGVFEGCTSMAWGRIEQRGDDCPPLPADWPVSPTRTPAP